MKKKKVTTREGGNGFFRFYYWYSLIFAVFGLIDVVYEFNVNGEVPVPWAVLLISYALTIFIVSIVALFRFKKHKFRRITLVMPIYQTASFILSIIAGIILAIYPFEGAFLWLIGVSAVLSLFELGFNGYIIYRFNNH